MGCPLCTSDRALKQYVEPIDVQDVLQKVANLTISTQSYQVDGPYFSMTKDFEAAFGLGGSDRLYSAVDAHGVALAAIQGLKELVDRQHERIDRLEDEHRSWQR